MAQLMNLRLSRNDQSSPWGFRLQGGKDFGTPLLIQKVNFGSLAEKAGLQVGDALVRVNGQDVYDVKHKEAQDVILRAGNAFELTIQRGGTSTWKPSVTPVGPSPVPNHLSHSPQLVTKTSLARVGPPSPAFGSSHNSVSRPFSSSPFLKPKPSTGSAFCPVVSKSVSYSYEKRASLCSQEISRTMNEFKHSLNDLNVVQYIESSVKQRPQSPIPDDKGQDFTSADAPQTILSLSPQKNTVRAISPNQLVIYPPEIPSDYNTYSKPSSLDIKNKITTMIEPPVFTTTHKINSETENIIPHCPDEYSKVTDLKCLPKFHGTKGLISMAMEIAPDRPFTPVAVTEPIIKPAPWISLPIENENRPESPLVAALKTAPERSYSPLPTFTYASELSSTPVEDPTKEFKKSPSVNELNGSIRNVNFSSLGPINTRVIGNNPVKYVHGYNTKTPVISLQNNKSSFQKILDTNIQKEYSTNVEFKPISSFNKPLLSGSYNLVESQSNNNETLTPRVTNLKESEKSNPEYLFTTLDQNESLNCSVNPQHLLFSNNKLTSNKTLSPGIKNKVSAFTSNSSIINTPFLRQLPTDQFKINQNINKSTSVTESLNTRQSNYPNPSKLTKAVPFFSNSTSSSTSLTKFS